MGKTYYMHTIDGGPGAFYSGEIWHAVPRRPAYKLERSLKDIRRQQRKSRKADKSRGMGDSFNYGHIRFEVPDD